MSIRRTTAIRKREGRQAAERVVWAMRAMMRELWRLRDAVAVVLDKEAARIGAARGERMIGVHIRRGDKSKELGEYVPTERYVDAAWLAVQETGCSTVFVASDAYGAVEEFRALFESRRPNFATSESSKEDGHEREVRLITSAGKARVGHEQMKKNQELKVDRSVHTLELLVDVEILARTEIFIATLSSNLARLVHMLRAAEPSTTWSLDIAWQPGVAFRSFGTDCCADDPLASATFCSKLALLPGEAIDSAE
mmetsp:Transcript_10797/g.22979  ORF Transcript_10797/g.22979 Transcript_10797/m.22979 type:complete len:253 (-) Transcript_10797:126-884(-)